MQTFEKNQAELASLLDNETEAMNEYRAAQARERRKKNQIAGMLTLMLIFGITSVVVSLFSLALFFAVFTIGVMTVLWYSERIDDLVVDLPSQTAQAKKKWELQIQRTHKYLENNMHNLPIA